jgi:hypothetical protein
MLPSVEKQYHSDLGTIGNEQLVEFQLNKVKSEKWFKTHLSLDSVIGC